MTDTKTSIKVVQGPRENIEDAACFMNIIFHTVSRVEAKLLIIADGVGGNCHGEIASQKTIEFLCMYLSAFLQNIDTKDCKAIKKYIAKALDKVNNQILAYWLEDQEFEGMSTTVVLALIIEDTAYIAWAGDSRCYIYNPTKKLQQITTDHSVTQELICQGLLDPEYAHFHPLAHAITQHLGKSKDFSPAILSKELNDGDIILLTSDGLTDAVDSNVISSILEKVYTEDMSTVDAVERLLQQALDNNTTDNATAVIYKHSSQANTSFKTACGTYPQALSEIFKTVLQEN